MVAKLSSSPTTPPTFGAASTAPGVQHINNPGYNRDRGPVFVPSFRAHLEF